jgi:hypothetical protein
LRIAVENPMDMGHLQPTYSKWITSQLQFIKDRGIRDIGSKEQPWQRIYPQENGIPCVSASGKYWVKVRFMGSERLVEVDDRMPCDFKSRIMLPSTINNFEIWPHILVKAYLKAYTYKWYSPENYHDKEIGDGTFVYSMTGLIPENLSVSEFDGKDMRMLRKYLSDESYFSKKTFITCYCDNEFKPKMPS